MLVDVRPVNRLRGETPVDAGAVLSPVIAGLVAEGVDLSRVRIVCDWLQYKNNFRETVQLRPICGGVEGAVEVAIDLRRAVDVDVQVAVKEALDGYPGEPRRVAEGVVLEDFGPTSQSCIWEFNSLYWKHLDLWERATGRAYEQALPGGVSDARNTEAAASIISGLFEVWDELSARRALPEELYVVELGVGNGGQAKVWLDEFRRMDTEHGTEYYQRLHYLMCDYSPYVLEMARDAVSEHSARVSSFVLDATAPLAALSFLKYKVSLVYVSNVYDNLPADELAHLGGRSYLVESRAYLPADPAREIAAGIGAEVADLPGLIQKLLRLGPDLASEALPRHWPDPEAAVRFWQQTWSELRSDERYVPLPGLDYYKITPTISGELLRPFIASGDDVRLHVNNGTVSSFVDTLKLLHPYGRLIAHDLFVRDVDEYRSAFRGPGKYEGSVVSWINGPLLTHIASRVGFEVTCVPFAHRKGTNIMTMTAQARD
jgi:hypothetical protein